MTQYLEATYEREAPDGTVISSVDLRIFYTFRPGCLVQIFGPAENCYPAEPDEIELDHLERNDGVGWIRFDRPAAPLASMEAAGQDALYDWAETYLDLHYNDVVADQAAQAAEAAEDRAEIRRERAQ